MTADRVTIARNRIIDAVNNGGTIWAEDAGALIGEIDRLREVINNFIVDRDDLHTFTKPTLIAAIERGNRDARAALKETSHAS